MPCSERYAGGPTTTPRSAPPIGTASMSRRTCSASRMPASNLGLEFLKLLLSKVECFDPCRLLRHDVALDRLLTLVGAGWGVLLALEGATATVYSGVTFREIHDASDPTRLNVRAYRRQANCNPITPGWPKCSGDRHV